jgi:endonuclease/exonuclease/phosphatase family metal-dependent hydrolase
VQLTVMTWNLRGHDGPDVDAVADVVRASEADVVALQEVQRHQARSIARRVGAASLGWGFKHWPAPIPPEGLAILGLTRKIRVRTRPLSFPFRLWSWRRRVFQLATIRPDGRRGPALALANTHFSAFDADDLRVREARTLVRALASNRRPAVVVGDLNDDPDAPSIARFRDAGFRDTWAEANPDGDGGATNWHGWKRGTTKRPNRRLDYVLVPAGAEVVEVTVPRPGDDGFDLFTTVSDHLPVVATLSFDGAAFDGSGDGDGDRGGG